MAVFNGGWQTRHGTFGVMSGGRILVPMRNELGTLAIFPDGQVRIGKWGDDFSSCEGFSTLRQNGPMIIDHGEINPMTEAKSFEFLGGHRRRQYGDLAFGSRNR